MHNQRANGNREADPANGTWQPSPVGSVRHLRLERDRHVAFAFAAADLLIEVSTVGVILAASGAAQTVLGVETDHLIGRPLQHFISQGDRAFVRRLLGQVQALYRSEPALVHIVRSDGVCSGILLGGCRLPDRTDSAFLSVALVPDALAQIPRPRDHATGLLTADALRDAAQHASGDQPGGTKQLQLLRLDGLSGAARQLPPDRATLLMQEIGAALRASSAGGDAAGRLSDDAFGVVTRPDHDATHDAALAADLADMIHGAGIPVGQVASRIVRLDIALGKLNNADAGRVLKCAMDAFLRAAGSEFDISALQSGLTAAVNQAASRFSDTRRMMKDERFSVVYQPVVDLSTREIHHYEALPASLMALTPARRSCSAKMSA